MKVAFRSIENSLKSLGGTLIPLHLTITGNYEQHKNASMEIRDGAVWKGFLRINGRAVLGGALNVIIHHGVETITPIINSTDNITVDRSFTQHPFITTESRRVYLMGK
jgi:hypothetical protein